MSLNSSNKLMPDADIPAFTLTGVPEDLVKIVKACVQSGKTILDMGCGPGRVSAMLRTAGYRVIAADYNNESFVPRDIPCYHVDCDDPASLKRVFGGHEFDAIVCSEVIEHLKNPFQFIETIVEFLKPPFEGEEGGQLFITTPNVVHPVSRVTLLVNGNLGSFGKGGESIGHINPIFKNTMGVAFKCASLESVRTIGIGLRYKWSVILLYLKDNYSLRFIILHFIILLLLVLMRNHDNKHESTLFIGRRVTKSNDSISMPGLGEGNRYKI